MGIAVFVCGFTGSAAAAPIVFDFTSSQPQRGGQFTMMQDGVKLSASAQGGWLSAGNNGLGVNGPQGGPHINQGELLSLTLSSPLRLTHVTFSNLDRTDTYTLATDAGGKSGGSLGNARGGLDLSGQNLTGTTFTFGPGSDRRSQYTISSATFEQIPLRVSKTASQPHMPEPGAMVLFLAGGGLIGLAIRRRALN